LYIVNTFTHISLIFAIFRAFSHTINTVITDYIRLAKIRGKIVALMPYLFYHKHMDFTKIWQGKSRRYACGIFDGLHQCSSNFLNCAVRHRRRYKTAR